MKGGKYTKTFAKIQARRILCIRDIGRNVLPKFRDGPLAKLWAWGREGNFLAARIFFRSQIPCMNFF